MRRVTPFAGILSILLALATPGAAQARAGRTVPLEVRMRRFLAEAGSEGRVAGEVERLLPYFPRRGEWERVRTFHRGSRPDSVVVERFRNADMGRAAKPGGPLCRSFDPGGGEHGAPLGTVPAEAGGTWRRVRATRFVPQGRSARSPIFVEWRREGNQWVISAMGEEADEASKLSWNGRPQIVPDSAAGKPLHLPLPADGAYAQRKPWFVSHDPIFIGSLRFVKYGGPRQLDDGGVVRFGSVDGVPAYREPSRRRVPEVVYQAVTPGGMFQPYQ
ncbi:MAG TPA: hypothetical protein VF541_18470, partial [Longimicrobium sp.]